MLFTSRATGTMTRSWTPTLPACRPDDQISTSPFGYGPHMCIGHPAKLELRILFEELLPRIKGIELAGERKVVQTPNFVGGLRNLPVRLESA